MKKQNSTLQELRLTRGDIAKFQVEVVNPNTLQPYNFQTGDTILFTIKKVLFDKSSLVSINGTFKVGTSIANFILEGSETINLNLGNYLCSIKLTTSTGEVHTIVAPSCDNLNRATPNFILCGE
ncbi:MAG: hypothetical protein ACRCX8_03430 [Sarcina sp.]